MGDAISTNGIDWFKYAGNPALKAGPEAYDQDVAGHGSVLKDGDTYKLWYHAIGDQGVIIAFATSFTLNPMMESHGLNLPAIQSLRQEMHIIL